MHISIELIMRLYSLTAYPPHGFPKFWDSYKTLTQARKTARDALKDGYHTVEIYRDQERRPDQIGVNRDHVETLTGA